MKNLVYLLLGLNIVYFIWYQAQPPETLPAPKVAPLPAEVEPLVLLSERNQISPEARKQDAPASDTVTEVEKAPDAEVPEVESEEIIAEIEVLPVCRTIGPIRTREGASEVRSQLLQQGFPADLRESEVQAPSGYQVYLPAMSSKKARELVKALEKAKMTDYFVGKRNRVSLGIFSSKAQAKIRQKDIRKLDYEALLDVRYKTRKVYWIDIDESDRTLQGYAGWPEIVQRHPQIQTQQVSCE
ncbi:hypothetical protein MNBD_GAMMA15-2000 [hydrothermal vent metagenome]|uniref:SPOR domain-containing protein n=1 Tax=hydrothermal vent metagenome TaxID=652676 RepID=A0A3B0YI21_9ZZZZ